MQPWMTQAWETLLNEFSDLGNVEQVTRVAVRLVIAGLLGGLIGYEREHRGKAAGVRTHILVSLGAALFVMVPQQSGVPDADLTRVLQGLIAGIGFLGAGTIFIGEWKHRVKGLTTAAGILMTCAFGATAGMGREATAIFSALLCWTILALGPLMTKRKPGNGEQTPERSSDSTAN
ncbi:MAG: MgtC/SapB family protein [Planctomycetota bacterium]